MFVGPNHPLFRDRREPGGARGPWGGDGYLPPMGAPPGARFDPIAPGGLGLPRRGGGGPFRGGPFGRQPGGGGGAAGPDNDDFPPPGFNDMYS
ncbi:hypothetical protein FRC02_000291 [Tulasnella sp. 418]|nr:hypothetical protein FRC02_000291 [Tulasnella sp. 418]